MHYRGLAAIEINEELFGCQFNVVSVVDSFLYIQLNIAGFEAGRGLATPQKILYINKLQKKFYEGDYSVFAKFLDIEVDFPTLQAIFNGTPFFPPAGMELSYQKDSISFDYPFFSMLTCEYYSLSLQLEVKKVTFNTVPEVSAVAPKNYSVIEF